MTQQEYEQKRAECWEEFKRTNLSAEVQWQPVNRYDVFCAAFDRAYALGREKEIISQDEIDKAAEDYVSFKKGGKCILSYIIDRACRRAFKGGANFALGKQEKDAEGEELLMCEKSKAMQLYSHLLDLVENERISEHYSEWCDLEREYIALFGENVFADYFGSKCLPDAHEVNFATKKPQPAEPKFKHKIGDKVRIVNDISHNNKYKGDITEIVYIDESNPNAPYKVYDEEFGVGLWCQESDLEPYTEPKEEADKQFDNILKDGFHKERRLNIAAQIVASMIGSDDWTTWRGGSNKEIWHNMAKSSLEIADALIDECEKGGIK